jgi:hypothetical protein
MTSSPTSWSFNNLTLKDEDLRHIRKDIYHSSGPGYFIFRAFFTPQQVAHAQQMWTAPSATRHFAPFLGKHQFRLGSPNFVKKDDRGNRVYYNFVWASPLDELTYEATFQIQRLRNRISGRNSSNELLPLTGNSVSYRVVLTRNAEAPVLPHRDFWEPDQPLSKKHDLSRVQATLMLSEHDKDYTGEGFGLVNNQGQKIVFGVDEPVQAGDLVIWRYSNIHSVLNVKSAEGQIGFLRILYPQEIIHDHSTGRRVVNTLKAVAGRGVWGGYIPAPLKNRVKTLLGVAR